jgi:hypothetical protein
VNEAIHTVLQRFHGRNGTLRFNNSAVERHYLPIITIYVGKRRGPDQGLAISGPLAKSRNAPGAARLSLEVTPGPQPGITLISDSVRASALSF